MGVLTGRYISWGSAEVYVVFRPETKDDAVALRLCETWGEPYISLSSQDVSSIHFGGQRHVAVRVLVAAFMVTDTDAKLVPVQRAMLREDIKAHCESHYGSQAEVAGFVVSELHVTKPAEELREPELEQEDEDLVP